MMGPDSGDGGRLSVAELVQDEVLFFGRFATHPAAEVRTHKLLPSSDSQVHGALRRPAEDGDGDSGKDAQDFQVLQCLRFGIAHSHHLKRSIKLHFQQSGPCLAG